MSDQKLDARVPAEKPVKLGLSQRVSLWIENTILTYLTPLDNPGPVFRWVFKFPIGVYRLGLGRLIGSSVLLLTTTGRKTGKRRVTPMEYNYDPASDTYRVIAGWGGHTDWYRNARANPQVHVQVGTRSVDAVAEPISEDEVTQMLVLITATNPGSLKMWSRWAGHPLDGSEASLREAARYFPSLRLRPVVRSAEKSNG
jgi:deazaflavin-dependent oxidoreductase (nitroreductase family)